MLFNSLIEMMDKDLTKNNTRMNYTKLLTAAAGLFLLGRLTKR